MLKNSCIMQAWQYLTLPLLYSEGLDGASAGLLLFSMPNFSHTLIQCSYVSSYPLHEWHK